MSALPDLYRRFHDAILTQEATLAIPDIKNTKAMTQQDRLAIYIDGYRLRLRQAVASDYPALCDYLGAASFDALALGYVEATPPSHYNLDRYPFGFAAWVAAHAPDRFAHDLAGLEGAIAEVFNGDESEALSAAMLATMDFGGSVLRLRAASRILRLSYPAHLWLDRQRGGEIAPAPQPEECFLYLYRHAHEVQREILSPAAYALLMALASGRTVAGALESVPDLSPSETEACFARWLAGGVFAA